jgi:hypothetical protein
MSDEEKAAPPEFTNASGDAIHISIEPHPSDNMRCIATVYSWSPVRMQADVDGPEIGVLESVAPAGDTPGEYTAAIVYDVLGPHTIHAWNNTCTCDADVFAGDIPAYDPSEYTLTPLNVISNERAKAAKIAATTGKLG